MAGLMPAWEGTEAPSADAVATTAARRCPGSGLSESMMNQALTFQSANKKPREALRPSGSGEMQLVNPARPYGLLLASVSKGSVSRGSRIIVTLSFIGKNALKPALY